MDGLCWTGPAGALLSLAGLGLSYLVIPRRVAAETPVPVAL
ncbi:MULTISPECIES: hypothetical protein [unclassified Nocardia]|nr:MULTISPECIES: hypothetical protein [unclassified Nocardia]